MAETALEFVVNGESVLVTVEPTKTLLQVLRQDLGLLSVKEGCSQGDCGSCIVAMNGRSVNACLVLAAQAEGTELVTVEGLSKNGKLTSLRRLFADLWAFQCGYCTPGMLMSCYALLLHNPRPARDEIQTAIEGNLCRCTSYRAVIDAVLLATGRGALDD